MSYLQKITAVLFFSLVFVAEAMASNPLYTVDVKVDVTDVNASEAREKAMNSANRQAFEIIVKKITTSGQASELLRLSDKQILNFIKEMAVISEKSSNVRYIADLQVTVNEDILKSYLSEKEIKTVVEAASKVVIVPVFRNYESDKPLLWEENNPWRKAWESNPPRNSLVTVNSLKYMPEVTADAALAYDSVALETVRLNNNANDVYVLDAVFDGIDGLKISVSSLKNAVNAGEIIRIPGDRNQPEELFARAIDEVRMRIENKIKSQNIADSQMQSSIDVLYNYTALTDWINVEKSLKNIAYIRDLQLIAMTPGIVQFRIDFIGSEDKIMQSIRDKGMNLTAYESIYQLADN